MRLTRLEINGFKSFGERTVLNFQQGITAVVGPNGCGKSNIADAILWCLGEQSPKTLRGDRMEDVLFNGSARRAPTGLAEVSLTLSGIRPDDLDSPASGYTELTIMRRLYRSGDSEYLINQVPCRLKDIRDLLIETGAGTKGHTVLEQGKVDGIINASPIERRALVEETAGIAKYKIRKTEALRKLEATEQNLLRVRDIVGEVKRQLASLDRQAKKAERYRQTYEELKHLELRAAGSRYQDWLAQIRELSTSVEHERVEETRLMAQIGTLDASLETHKAEAADVDLRHRHTHSELVAAETRAREAVHRMEFLAAQTAEWSTQHHELTLELEALARALADQQDEYARCQTDCVAVDAAIHAQTALLGEREEAVRVVEQRLGQAAAEIEQTRHRVFEAVSGMTACTNTLSTLAGRRDELDKRRARYQEDLDATRTEIAHKRALHDEIDASHRLHAQTHATQDAERAALRDASITRQAALQEGEAALTARHAELTRSRATLESLLALQRDLVGYDEGVRQVLHGTDSAAPVPGLLGVVADVLEIPTQYERAIEGALADRLQGVVAEGDAAIFSALLVLDEQNAGRATFVPRRPRVQAAAHPSPPSGRGVYGLANDLIGCRTGFEALRAVVLDRLVLVEDRETARQRWAADEHGYTWVALSGEVYDSTGIVSGGAGPRAGLNLLERKRTIKTLEQDVLAAERTIEPIQREVADLRAALETDRLALERLDTELREGELQLMHDRKGAEALLQELVQLEKRVELLGSEDGAAQQELAAMAQTALENQTALVSLEQQKTAYEQALLTHYDAASRLKASLAEAAAAVTEVRLALATEGQKREHAMAVHRTIRTRLDELSGQLAAKQAARDHLAQRTAAAAQERETVAATLRSTQTAIGSLRLAVSDLERTRAESAHRIREEEDLLRAIRRDADALQQRLQTLSISLAETKLRAAQQATEILDRYQMDLTVFDLGTLPPATMDPSDLDPAIAELRQTLVQLGGANLAAIDEYRELEERYRFLTAQETDLSQSMANLRLAIDKINGTTRELFLDAFHALNDRFGAVYASFFEGGQAELRLVDEANPLDSGIEIVAQPPGKKLRHISLLSGGEKALTAIALLFASFLIHPSPFCVMDEIDAPLDEENVRRFTQALRPMTAHSQFLVVTHNRRTMEQADVLYGVTMEEPGISKLVSVRLHGATANGVIDVETAAAEV